MPNPYVRPVVLGSEESQRLHSLTRAHSTPQALVFRCRLSCGWLIATNRPIYRSLTRLAVAATPYVLANPLPETRASRFSRCSATGSATELFPPTNSSKCSHSLLAHELRTVAYNGPLSNKPLESLLLPTEVRFPDDVNWRLSSKTVAEEKVDIVNITCC